MDIQPPTSVIICDHLVYSPPSRPRRPTRRAIAGYLYVEQPLTLEVTEAGKANSSPLKPVQCSVQLIYK